MYKREIDGGRKRAKEFMKGKEETQKARKRGREGGMRKGGKKGEWRDEVRERVRERVRDGEQLLCTSDHHLVGMSVWNKCILTEDLVEVLIHK